MAHAYNNPTAVDQMVQPITALTSSRLPESHQELHMAGGGNNSHQLSLSVLYQLVCISAEENTHLFVQYTQRQIDKCNNNNNNNKKSPVLGSLRQEGFVNLGYIDFFF